jgi:hypothetical protein
MYRLEVRYPKQRSPAQTRWVESAADVLTVIPELLKEHQGCERIIVWLDTARLFAVDCNGHRLND